MHYSHFYCNALFHWKLQMYYMYTLHDLDMTTYHYQNTSLYSSCNSPLFRYDHHRIHRANPTDTGLDCTCHRRQRNIRRWPRYMRHLPWYHCQAYNNPLGTRPILLYKLLKLWLLCCLKSIYYHQNTNPEIHDHSDKNWSYHRYG